jgi:hypothetical protein
MGLLSWLTNRNSGKEHKDHSILPNGAIASSLYANKEEDLYLYHLSQEYSLDLPLKKNLKNARLIQQEITSDILVSMSHTLKQKCPQFLERHMYSPVFGGLLLVNPTALIPSEVEVNDGKPTHKNAASGWSASLLIYEPDIEENSIVDFMSEIEVSYKTSPMFISEYEKFISNLGRSDEVKVFVEGMERELSDYIFWADLNLWE